MTISIDILFTLFLTVLGAIVGAIWGHHGQIKERVTRLECQHNRENCPCAYDIKNIKEKIMDELNDKK